jgi:hypothetical protein
LYVILGLAKLDVFDIGKNRLTSSENGMSLKTILPAIVVTLLGSLAVGSAGFAQEAAPDHPANHRQGMMGGTNPSPQGPGMMGGTSDMTDMMNMMRQMTRMMENCNRMMESASQNAPAPEKPPAAKTPPG